MKLNKVFETGLKQIKEIDDHYTNCIWQEFNKCNHSPDDMDNVGKQIVIMFTKTAKDKMCAIMDYLWEFVEIKNKSSKAQYEYVLREYNEIRHNYSRVLNSIN